MTTSLRRPGFVLALAVLAMATSACSTGRGRERRAGTPSDNNRMEPSGPSGGEVSLTNQDLAPMDAYIKRRFWILGDDVEIVASKEYFIQNLSISARIGLVRREDSEGPEEARSVLTFVGRPEAVDISTAPRVMIGTGITVTARHQIVIRFLRTKNADLPVRIRISANGKASVGSGDNVQRREPTIIVGAQLRRMGGAYEFQEQGGQ